VIELFNAKYETDYGLDFVDPEQNARSACDRSGRSASTLTTSPARQPLDFE